MQTSYNYRVSERLHRTILNRSILIGLFLAGIAPFALAQQPAKPKVTTGPSEIKIVGAVTTPLVVKLADLRTMPRKTLRVENLHTNKMESYEGVPLAELLLKAGALQAQQLRGLALAKYVVIGAADNYRVVFSLAELDPGTEDSEILLADTMDGSPLPPDQGPFKLIVPHEKSMGRWIKMVSSISVESPAN